MEREGEILEEIVKSENKEGCLLITLNRPDRRNAINYDTMDRLKELLEKAAADDRVKALAITGAGNHAFCSGGDLKEFQNLKTEQEAYGMLSKMGMVVYQLATFPKPTVAVLNGTAIGGGCEIAAACDFRLAYSQAKIGFIQGNLGITTGWGGASILLEKMPYQTAMRLLLSAQKMTAEEAKSAGFVDAIIDSFPEGLNQFIQSFLDKEAQVLSAYKSAAVRKWVNNNLQERINKEIRECARLWATDSHEQAVQRFIQKAGK
ncbi:enoyl-CoA hydratase/isomerase family protein [Peribacillus sp. SCS-155]|uniref:enoyl-CoA hydratase/isomerase family protein n=1 Tax=Peribacillus sedimenti TaxID=3115297 RepID=UPI0039064F0F